MAEQRNIHTRGIILKKHPLGENDFSVTFYCPELGKIQATAKGARKITSSLGGHIETLNLCRMQLYKSPVRFTIVQCEIEENFKNIRQDFERCMVGSLIIEILYKSTHSSEHAPELFRLLEQTLDRLNTSGQHFLTVESFKLNLLRHIGVLPDLENCGSCHRRWTSNNTIWLESGGHMNCQDCISETQNPTSTMAKAKAIEFNIIKLIRYLTQAPVEQTKKISFTPEQRKQLEHITRFFLQHFLDREILSERIMMDLQN